VPTTSSLAFVNPWFNPINPAAYHPVTIRLLDEALAYVKVVVRCICSMENHALLGNNDILVLPLL
jgi:hypothetical protein